MEKVLTALLVLDELLAAEGPRTGPRLVAGRRVAGGFALWRSGRPGRLISGR